MNPFLEKKKKVEGPELAQELVQAQALEPEPEEQPMVPEEATPAWRQALRALPGLVGGLMHVGGQGTEETRAMVGNTMQQITQANEHDRRRVAASRATAHAYNNRLAQRKQERKRQGAQDTIAAEDRNRRIGREEQEASVAAQERDPATPKNQALRQGIAQNFPEAWKNLTPEQQAAITTQNYEEVLGIPITEERRKRKLQDEMTAERSKQKAEFDFATPGGGVGGLDYFAALAAGRSPPSPGAPPSPTPEAPPNPLVKDVSDAYKGIENVPPEIMARVRGALAASQAGLNAKDMSTLHQQIMGQVSDDLKDTSTRERQTRQDEAATKKADAQQDAQYSAQRNIRNIDKVRSKLMALKKLVSKYQDKDGNLVGDLPGSGVTGAIPKPFQLALTPEGRQIMKLKKELLDVRIREATGAAASEGEVKQFSEMAGIGTWDTDQDLIAGMNNAEAILDQQEAFLDAAFVDPSIRFKERVKEQEAKKVPAKATIQGDQIILPNGGRAPNTPKNRKLVGLE